MWPYFVPLVALLSDICVWQVRLDYIRQWRLDRLIKKSYEAQLMLLNLSMCENCLTKNYNKTIWQGDHDFVTWWL